MKNLNAGVSRIYVLHTHYVNKLHTIPYAYAYSKPTHYSRIAITVSALTTTPTISIAGFIFTQLWL